MAFNVAKKIISAIAIAAAITKPVFGNEEDYSIKTLEQNGMLFPSEKILKKNTPSNTKTNKYFITLQANQSLMSVARDYGLTLTELKNLNPGIELSKIVTGSRIRIAPGGPPGTSSLISNVPDRTLKALKAEGKSCNLVNDSYYSSFDYVEDRTYAMAYLMTTYKKPFKQSVREKPKGVNPFDAKASRSDLVSVRTDCALSQVKLFCDGGSCYVFFNSKEYGYHPSYRSTVIVDGRKYSWVGDQPDWIGRELWGLLREGSVIKSSLALWPSGRTNFRDTINGVSELKNIVYKESLQKE